MTSRSITDATSDLRAAARMMTIDSEAHTHREGDVIVSKYALEGMLGEGGMGTVWVARNLALDVRVALKLVRPGLEVADAAGRLLDEARAEARLEHPAIVRVFDFGTTEEGAPFIVMELLEGRTFGDLLRRSGPLSATAAVQIMLPVLDALVMAHERGIVHRDLTPENIFLARVARRLQPKIVDFGIALLEGPARRVTGDGTIIGSPRYMSPEQATDEDDVDHRSDLWTVCVVLYEAITGRPAFDGHDYASILKAVVEQQVVPPSHSSGDGAALWPILRKGLSKDRSSRWQSAGSLGRALAMWLSEQGVREDACGASINELWLPELPFDADPDVSGDALPLVHVRAVSSPPRDAAPRPRAARRGTRRPEPAASIVTPGIPPSPRTSPTVPLERNTVSAVLIAAAASAAIALFAVLGLGEDTGRPAGARDPGADRVAPPQRRSVPGSAAPALTSAMNVSAGIAPPGSASGPMAPPGPAAEPVPSRASHAAPPRATPLRHNGRRAPANPADDSLDLKEPYL